MSFWRRQQREIGLHGLVLGLILVCPPLQAEQKVDFQRDVWPILQAKCVGCHTEAEPEGGLNMESFAAFRAGGTHGPAFTPGAAASSRLFMMAAGKQEPVMPPDGEPLSQAELDVLQAWIEQGAEGPDGDMPLRQLITPEIEPVAGVRPATAVAVIPEGPTIVARYGGLEFYDDLSEPPKRTLSIGELKINAVRLHPDGRHLIIAGGVDGLRGVAQLRRIDSGELVQSFEGHRDTLFDAQLSSDGKWLATGGYDRVVRIWEVDSGKLHQALTEHNGAISRVAFTPDGQLLITASADETVKVWRVADGQRLDTLPQPQGEVNAVVVTPDGQRVVAASSDNQFRVWDLVSRKQPRINPLRLTRVADEAPLMQLAITPTGDRMVVVSAAGVVKTYRTADWQSLDQPVKLAGAAADLRLSDDGKQALIPLLTGDVVTLDLPESQPQSGQRNASRDLELIVQLPEPSEWSEKEYRDHFANSAAVAPPRGFRIDGVIERDRKGLGETDRFVFRAEAGEVWVIETEAAQNGSPLDTIVEVTDAETDQPLIAARLQAIRESYFTFRGKDSRQSNDFRLFAWEEMELNDYLYAAGEVTKLWIYPRGPDSGFNVYPGQGQRWTYFGTSAVTHALGEPAYIVRPLESDEPPLANGLPMFEIPVANDDDPTRARGSDSYVRMVAPYDGNFAVHVRDVRRSGGEDYRYRLTARPAAPDFSVNASIAKPEIPRGAGREVRLNVKRLDGFNGPLTFRFESLPVGLHVASPIVVEAGQPAAYSTVWADRDADPAQWPEKIALRGTVTAMIAGRKVQRPITVHENLKLAPAPTATLRIEPLDESETAEPTQTPAQSWTLTLRRGETRQARIIVERNGHQGEIALGKEFAGRNAAHGVFVDNIGLNGLLITSGSKERNFFMTAAPIAKLGARPFFLKANLGGQVGEITSPPITVEVTAGVR